MQRRLRIGLATLQHGRRAHLERQAAEVNRLTGVARYLIVSMDDTPVPPGAEVLRRPAADPDRLNLAAARNAAIEALGDCDLAVLLDVDCIPDPGLIAAYAGVAERAVAARALLLGPVGWLDRPLLDAGLLAGTSRRLSSAVTARARTTVKRRFPQRGVAVEPRPELFWSLSFAVAPGLHRAIGGFDEGFAGWGAEDTDYGRRAVQGGARLWKVAGAWAYHQPHPPARTTPGQIAALADNANRFHDRWGDWPMPDVLAELAASGAIRWTADRVVARWAPRGVSGCGRAGRLTRPA